MIKNLDRLYEISQLKENWNGYDSKAISEEIIKISEVIVKNICVQPMIYPTGRSTIQMQYELNDGSYLEFEIFEEKIVCMEVLQRIYTKASFVTIEGNDIESINKIVKEFHKI